MIQTINYIKKMIVFIILLILLILLLNAAYMHFIYSKYQIYGIEKMYNEFFENLNPKILNFGFFGGSHIVEGVNPAYIPNSYNFAVPAGNYIKTNFIFRKVTQLDKIKLNAAVFELDPHTFTYNFEKGNAALDDLPYYSKFFSYSEIAKTRGESIIAIWLEANLPVIGRGIEFLRPKDSPFSGFYRGWANLTNDFSKNENMRKAALGTFRLQYEDSDRIANKSLQFFIKTLDLAKQENVSIVFIKMPLSEEYFELLNENNITNDEYYKFLFDTVESRVGKDYYILNYSNVFINNTDYFGDSDHLNYRGAENISKRIYFDLIELKEKEKIKIDDINYR